MATPRHLDREQAREILTKKIAGQRKLLTDKFLFTTVDPYSLIDDAEWRLRWIDCAPEGANHQAAPLQDKDGVPMGGNYNENVGAGKNVREARVARGLDPIDPFGLGRNA